MTDYFQEIVLERLNFFSSEQGYIRNSFSKQFENINKLLKARSEYCKSQTGDYASKSVPCDALAPYRAEYKYSSLNLYGNTEAPLFKKKRIDELNISNINEYIARDHSIKWAPRFKLNKVISGHKGWVRSIAVDPSNNFFVSGSSDKLIKFWDINSGILKLTLTGHIAAVRKVLLSERHPFLFSCSEDKTMKCWDLEQNRIVRNYARHSSGIYCLDIHPRLDIVATGSRDGSVVLWDIRTRESIHLFKNHKAAVSSILMQSVEPQLISGSYDRTIRTWDIVAGKSRDILTRHIKPIRALAKHPIHYSFLSAGADCIKIWEGEDSTYLRDLSSSQSIINTITIKSQENNSIVLAGCDNGQLHFWDYETGTLYDTIQSSIQPGSVEAENSILDCKFDRTESVLITGECDKTIKIWNLKSAELI
ncbi:WD domain G-beta repeat family protein [Cryptosporidium meleagridis]|uniref:WD domain G-beta repeat family protein n=1 Tax=Cryptosporidium meleagridis TaxID=93969 RepID=A0A2P4Z1V6_9CRYT|nr:WD domain G-beta repeat family protein [Cryptosporidium meleagridis]